MVRQARGMTSDGAVKPGTSPESMETLQRVIDAGGSSVASLMVNSVYEEAKVGQDDLSKKHLAKLPAAPLTKLALFKLKT